MTQCILGITTQTILTIPVSQQLSSNEQLAQTLAALNNGAISLSNLQHMQSQQHQQQHHMHHQQQQHSPAGLGEMSSQPQQCAARTNANTYFSLPLLRHTNRWQYSKLQLCLDQHPTTLGRHPDASSATNPANASPPPTTRPSVVPNGSPAATISTSTHHPTPSAPFPSQPFASSQHQHFAPATSIHQRHQSESLHQQPSLRQSTSDGHQFTQQSNPHTEGKHPTRSIQYRFGGRQQLVVRPRSYHLRALGQSVS